MRALRPLIAVVIVPVAVLGLALGGCGGEEEELLQVPSSAMEPTLHCAMPEPGCEAEISDLVVVRPGSEGIERGDIVVFESPPLAEELCGAGGTFVKRLVGLPGEVIEVRRGVMEIKGREQNEPYVGPGRRGGPDYGPETVPPGQYFMMGDNRSASCDSRVWGGVPEANILGKVTAIERGPERVVVIDSKRIEIE